MEKGCFFELPVVVTKQKGHNDCCTAALSTLFSALGIKTDYDDLRIELNNTSEGVTDTSKITQALIKRRIAYEELNLPETIDLNEVLDEDHWYFIHIQAPNSDYRPEFLTAGDRTRVGKSINHGHYCLLSAYETDDSGKISRLWLIDSLINKGETPQGEGARVMSLGWFLKRFIDVEEHQGWAIKVAKKQPATNKITPSI